VGFELARVGLAGLALVAFMGLFWRLSAETKDPPVVVYAAPDALCRRRYSSKAARKIPERV
jgi:hypothetical protein